MRFHEFNLKENATDIVDIFNTMSNAFNPKDAPSNTSAGSNTSGNTSTAGDNLGNVNIGKPSPNSVSHRDVSSYLKRKGLDNNHILGMLANIAGESGFNSGAYHIDSNGLPSGGLFQHNGPRFEKMVKSIGSDWSTDWQGQIDYALSEPEGRQYMNTKFSSPEKAVEWWVINFERPKYAQSDINKRIQLLKNFG